MKYQLLFFICLCLPSNSRLKGQTSTPISIAYFGQFGIEPGLKVSTEFDLSKWTTALQRTKHKHLFVSPQIGYFIRPSNNSNLFLNADIGIKKQKEDKSAFSAFSLGLGYLHQFQVSAVAIQLGDGSQSTSRNSNAYFLPSLNFAFGNKFSPNLGWYSKIGAGQRLGGGVRSSLIVLIDVGLQFSIGR